MKTETLHSNEQWLHAVAKHVQPTSSELDPVTDLWYWFPTKEEYQSFNKSGCAEEGLKASSNVNSNANIPRFVLVPQFSLGEYL